MAEFAVPRRERGAALLTVLMLVAIMAIVTATALERLTLATRLAGNAAAIDQARAYGYAAETLAAARIGDLVAAQGDRTSLKGGWNGGSFTLPIPGGLGSARVSDGGNCFNVNSVVTGGTDPAAADLTIRPGGQTQFRALMEVLGIDATAAQTIAAATVDWIDSDDSATPNGAESDFYAQRPTPYRTANQLMVDPSELRVVNGVTPSIYSTLRPWLCALPVSDMSPINVNTLLPSQAPLFAMLIPGQLSVGRARELLARRPPNGYGSTVEFWSIPAKEGLTTGPDVGSQTVVKTRWFNVATTIELAGATAQETALFDAKATPARLVRRTWGEEG
ncbi:MAG: type II secretion system minor pseudopilin GspK [Pseudomonadota bacterium]